MTRAERDAGKRPGLTTDERQRLKDLEREVFERRRANEILKKASVFHAGGARPPSEVMVRFIDEYREAHGVEPVCAVLPIAPSVYHEYKQRECKPELRPTRTVRDERLRVHIQSVWDSNFEVYGVRKVWNHLVNDDKLAVARCTVARLMRVLGLQGAVRGKRFKVTTGPDTGAVRPPDLVERRLTATRPDELWVARIELAPERFGARCDGAGAL